MGRQDRAIVARPLARTPDEGTDRVARAEAALRATLEEVTRLDAEIEALSAELADFARLYERVLGAAYQDLSAAEALVRRLQALEDGLVALAARLRGGGAPSPGARRGRAPRRSAPSPRTAPRPAAAEPDGPEIAPETPDAPPEIEAPEIALKRLYRRLARLLHPDLAPDDAERARLGDLMARVNAAYRASDLTALELIAERVGAGAPLGDLSPDERLAHLERRTATLARIAASLTRERDRLLRSDTARLREEARRRAGEGGDGLAETADEVRQEAEAAYADALHRLTRLSSVARDVSRARTTTMTKLTKRGPTGARRAFDPLEEAEIVRMGVARLERRRATPAARALARELEAIAPAAPWDVALALLAFFAEDAGGRPPDALATVEGWGARWERLRAAWPGAPELSRMLARLPPHLALGARAQGGDVVAGVQLADAELLAGVRIAMERTSVAAIAREALAALGPDEACDACGESGPARHVLRTRGLDELNGLACASCGAVLRSYWRYGDADGLEALAPHALRLGLVAEVTAQLAGTAIGFQMLPAQREALTAERLRRHFAELYLRPYEVPLAARSLAVVRGKETLPPRARVGDEGRLRLVVSADAGLTDEGLLELLRARIERRFRP